MPESIPPSPSSDKKKPLSTFDKLKRWGGVASVVIGLGGAVGTIWKTITYIDELHDTIGANKAEVQTIRRQLDEDHDDLQEQLSAVASAVRAQRDRDQEVITNLRIAVAALQASQAVRAGRASYTGIDGPEGNPQMATARPVRPDALSARARRSQAARAEEDASAALRRAERIQQTSDDPLAALEGL